MRNLPPKRKLFNFIGIKMYKKILSLIAVVILCGCETIPQRENLKIGDRFFKTKPKVVILQLDPLGRARYIKDGDQGLLDFAINKMVCSGQEDAINNIDTDHLLDVAYFKNFKQTFTTRGAKILEDKKPLVIKDFQPTDPKFIELAAYDFTHLRNQFKADYALILHMTTYGLIRSYYGFIPTGAPEAFANFTISLVDLKTNVLLGYYTSKNDGTSSMGGIWNHEDGDVQRHLEDHIDMKLENARQFLISF